MHKLTSLILGAFVLFAAAPAYAATISLTPTTVSVKKGETVSLSVAVDPQSVKLGLVKVALSFPANLLEATAFTLASTDEWLTPPGAGNSVTDNTGGSLIKTAGYLGGFTTIKTFGTATFRAKTDGVATVAVVTESFAYNAQNTNALSGTQGSSAITVAPAPAPTPAPAPDQAAPSTQAATVATVAPTETVEATTTATSTLGAIAAVGATGFSFGSMSSLLSIVLILAILGGGTWLWRRERSDY